MSQPGRILHDVAAAVQLCGRTRVVIERHYSKIMQRVQTLLCLNKLACLNEIKGRAEYISFRVQYIGHKIRQDIDIRYLTICTVAAGCVLPVRAAFGPFRTAAAFFVANSPSPRRALARGDGRLRGVSLGISAPTRHAKLWVTKY